MGIIFSEIIDVRRWAGVLLFLCCFLVASAQQRIGVDHSGIEYVGRWDRSLPDEFRSHWGGAYFRVHFTGSTLGVVLKERTVVRVMIDTFPMRTIQANAGSSLLASGLPEGKHVAVVASSSDRVEIPLQGLLIAEGARILPVGKKRKLIEFVGNSITVGDRTSFRNQSAFPWLAAMQMGCNHAQIAFCGITLTDGYHYNYPGAPQQGMERQYFSMEQPNHPVGEWDFRNYRPDLIVLNLGTNDHGCRVPTDEFICHYRAFIVHIRQLFPKTPIAVMRLFAGHYEKDIRQMAEDFRKEGDRHLYYIDTQGWIVPGTDDLADDSHPSEKGHRKIADCLIPELEEILR